MTLLVENRELVVQTTNSPVVIIPETRELVLQQVPGVGPPGSIEGGFSVNGAPPFDMSGSIEGVGGILVVAQGLRRFYMSRPGTIAYVTFSAGLVPQGSEAAFDVNKNGTSIWSLDLDKPTISPGFNVSLNVIPQFANFLAGDYFTVDCDRIGSSVAGGYVTFSIWYF